MVNALLLLSGALELDLSYVRSVVRITSFFSHLSPLLTDLAMCCVCKNNLIRFVGVE